MKNNKSFIVTLVLFLLLNGLTTIIQNKPASAATVDATATINYSRGVNLAGPGFGGVPIWTKQDLIDYYANKGFDIFRISITWERIQPVLGGPLDTKYLNDLKAEIGRLNNDGKKAIIDLHNYGRYNNKIIGDIGSGVTTADFTDVWTKISTEFKGNSAVYGYDLMNEPHDMGTTDWKDISQAAVTAIRNNGDNTLIFVEGTAWSSSYQWEANNNSPTGWIIDPANNFMYSAHIYFDYDRTGTYKKTYDEELALNPDLDMIGVQRSMDFLVWCAKNQVRGYFGEFGTPKDDIRWNKVLDNFMKVLDEYGMDATYWAGGAFGDSYNLNLNPVNGVDAIQMSVLSNHLSGSISSMPSLPEGIHEAEDLTINAINGSHTVINLKSASGGKYDSFNASGSGDYIEYKVNVPQTGSYQVKVKVNQHLDNGRYQMSIDGVNQSNAFDTYFFTVDDDKIYDLGYVSFDSPGDKLIRFTCIGKNVTATGYKLPLDYIQLAPFSGPIPEPVPPPAPDLVAPSAPTGLTLTAANMNEVDLKWSPSTDNVGVIGYIVYRDGIEIARTTVTQYSDKGVQPSISYRYTVKAYDRQNLSDAGNEASIMTQNTPPIFLPISDAQQIQYTVSQSSVGGKIASKAAFDSVTGKITLSMDLSQAWIAHEQHPFFYYVPLYGDGEVIARLTNADMANYAGVMVAERVTDDAPRLLMTGLTTDGYNADWGKFKVQSLARTITGTATSKNRSDAPTDAIFKQVTAPFWVKIARTGDKVSSYIKNADGSWGNGKGQMTPLRMISFDGVSDDAPVYAGVAMSGDRTKGTKWSAQFDNFTFPSLTLPGKAGVPLSFPVKTFDLDQQAVTVRIASSQLPAEANVSFQHGEFTWSNPRAGQYKVTFEASDGYGEPAYMTVTLKIAGDADVQPPITTDNADGAWHNTAQTLKLSATDDLSGVNKTLYKVDGDEWTEGDAVNLERDGIHSIQYYSIDFSGNTETPKSTLVKIDQTPPSIELSIPDVVYRTDRISWPVVISDNLSGIAATDVKLDGVEVNSDTLTWEPFALPIGSHTLIVSAMDNAGNMVEKQYEFMIKIDVQHLDEAIQIGKTNGWIDNDGIFNSLLVKVNHLQDGSLSNLQISAGLNALQNEILAQSGKQIDKDYSDFLLSDVRFLIDEFSK